MEKFENQIQTELNKKGFEEKTVIGALIQKGFSYDQAVSKIAELQNKEARINRDIAIREVSELMKSYPNGYSCDHTYRMLAVVCDLSINYTTQKALSKKVMDYKL